jgi:uncharacterized protein YcfJ
MKKRNKLLILYIIIAIFYSSCSTWRKLDNTEKGSVIGAGSGALVGDIVAPGVGGTLVGGAIGAVGGGLIGNEIDKDKNKKR